MSLSPQNNCWQASLPSAVTVSIPERGSLQQKQMKDHKMIAATATSLIIDPATSPSFKGCNVEKVAGNGMCCVAALAATLHLPFSLSTKLLFRALVQHMRQEDVKLRLLDSSLLLQDTAEAYYGTEKHGIFTSDEYDAYVTELEEAGRLFFLGHGLLPYKFWLGEVHLYLLEEIINSRIHVITTAGDSLGGAQDLVGTRTKYAYDLFVGYTGKKGGAHYVGLPSRIGNNPSAEHAKNQADFVRWSSELLTKLRSLIDLKQGQCYLDLLGTATVMESHIATENWIQYDAAQAEDDATDWALTEEEEEAAAIERVAEFEAERVAREAEAEREASAAQAERVAREAAEAERVAREEEAAAIKRVAEFFLQAERVARAAEAEAAKREASAVEAEAEHVAREDEAKRVAREAEEAKREASAAEAEAERVAREDEAEREASAAQAERVAREAAEAERVAREEDEAERVARAAEAKREASVAEDEAKRVAREAEAERVAREEAEAKREASAAAAEAERVAREEDEAERVARAAEVKREASAAEAEAERVAREVAEAKREASAAAAEREASAAEAKREASAAEAERVAREAVEAKREASAAEAEAERVAREDEPKVPSTDILRLRGGARSDSDSSSSAWGNDSDDSGGSDRRPLQKRKVNGGRSAGDTSESSNDSDEDDAYTRQRSSPKGKGKGKGKRKGKRKGNGKGKGRKRKGKGRKRKGKRKTNGGAASDSDFDFESAVNITTLSSGDERLPTGGTPVSDEMKASIARAEAADAALFAASEGSAFVPCDSSAHDFGSETRSQSPISASGNAANSDDSDTRAADDADDADESDESDVSDWQPLQKRKEKAKGQRKGKAKGQRKGKGKGKWRKGKGKGRKRKRKRKRMMNGKGGRSAHDSSQFSDDEDAYCGRGTSPDVREGFQQGWCYEQRGHGCPVKFNTDMFGLWEQRLPAPLLVGFKKLLEAQPALRNSSAGKFFMHMVCIAHEGKQPITMAEVKDTLESRKTLETWYSHGERAGIASTSLLQHAKAFANIVRGLSSAPCGKVLERDAHIDWHVASSATMKTINAKAKLYQRNEKAKLQRNVNHEDTGRESLAKLFALNQAQWTAVRLALQHKAQQFVQNWGHLQGKKGPSLSEFTALTDAIAASAAFTEATTYTLVHTALQRATDFEAFLPPVSSADAKLQAAAMAQADVNDDHSSHVNLSPEEIAITFKLATAAVGTLAVFQAKRVTKKNTLVEFVLHNLQCMVFATAFCTNANDRIGFTASLTLGEIAKAAAGQEVHAKRTKRGHGTNAHLRGIITIADDLSRSILVAYVQFVKDVNAMASRINPPQGYQSAAPGDLKHASFVLSYIRCHRTYEVRPCSMTTKGSSERTEATSKLATLFANGIVQSGWRTGGMSGGMTTIRHAQATTLMTSPLWKAASPAEQERLCAQIGHSVLMAQQVRPQHALFSIADPPHRLSSLVCACISPFVHTALSVLHGRLPRDPSSCCE